METNHTGGLVTPLDRSNPTVREQKMADEEFYEKVAAKSKIAREKQDRYLGQIVEIGKGLAETSSWSEESLRNAASFIVFDNSYDQHYKTPVKDSELFPNAQANVDRAAYDYEESEAIYQSGSTRAHHFFDWVGARDLTYAPSDLEKNSATGKSRASEYKERVMELRQKGYAALEKAYREQVLKEKE